jgi:6-phosphogluconolactonase
MAAAAEVITVETAAELAADVVTRIVTTLAAAQSERGYATLALTGGSILEQVFGALADSADRSDVDWTRVDVYWGDERFVPAGSKDRNDVPALDLLSALSLDPARVHPMPSSDGPDGPDLDAAAARYAALLAQNSDPAHRYADDVVAFDIALIGVGPDGHCCSLFPDQPGPLETVKSVVGVRNSPKPPPERLSLTLRALEAADQVWVIASGEGKATAVAEALGGAAPDHVPSAGARGHNRTLWLLDRDAASKLPATRP